MMKFGRLVNLEALQTLSVNTNLEELKMKMMEREQLYAMEIKKWEVRLSTESYCDVPRNHDRMKNIRGISSVKTVEPEKSSDPA